MKIAIIHSVSGKSASALAEGFNTRTYGQITAEVFRPFKDGRENFSDFDYVFSLGCSANTVHKNRINRVSPVLTCVDKTRSFEAFNKANVSTVAYCTRKADVPKTWDTVVIRDKIDGRKAEGLKFANQCDGEPIPDGLLFTEHFDHKMEFRIVVFMGQVVGRYLKRTVDGEWIFDLLEKRGFEKMDDHCIRAATALGIDYVGFDVVANNKKDFAILEANSGAIMTDEAETAIIEYFINL